MVLILRLGITEAERHRLNIEDMPLPPYHNEPHINVRTPSGEVRQYFVEPALETKIKAYWKEFREDAKEGEPFLINERGERLSSKNACQRLKRIGRKLGIEHLCSMIFKRTLRESQAGRENKRQQVPWALPLRRFIVTNVDIPKDAKGKPDKDEVDYQIQVIKNAHKRSILTPELPEPVDGWLGARYKYNFPVHKMRRRWPRWRRIKGLADLRPLLSLKIVMTKQS